MVQVAAEVASVTERVRGEQEEEEERHRRLVGELHQRHKRDLEAQLAAFRGQAQRKEAHMAAQITDMETRYIYLNTPSGIKPLGKENKSLN